MAFPRVPPGCSGRVWLFDLDNTLHDASHAAFGSISAAMTAYIATHTGLDEAAATALRQHYWKRYGATLLGLIRYHAVRASHFLEETHALPELEASLRTSAHDRAALKALRGPRYVLTNAPRKYAVRVLAALRLTGCFRGVISIEDMAMFGSWRPKPDRRMLRRVVTRLGVLASRCWLVEDTLEHQKAACSLGMKTVWMQRYLEGRYRGHPGRPQTRRAPREVGVHHAPKPPYVYARIRSLRQLPRGR